MDKKKIKDKLMFAGVIAVLLVVSILTSKVNLADEISGFFKRIWINGQEAAEESDKDKTMAKGAHVEIIEAQVIRVREIYEIMGQELDEGGAVAVLKEEKTLAYHGKQIGLSAGRKEIDACISDLKKKFKKADESQYNRVVRRYGDEKDYWKLLEQDIEEYLIAEKMRAEKEEELAQKVDIDLQKELQDYIDKIVDYEEFSYYY